MSTYDPNNDICEICNREVWGSECYPCKDRADSNHCPDTDAAAADCQCTQCVLFFANMAPNFTRDRCRDEAAQWEIWAIALDDEETQA